MAGCRCNGKKSIPAPPQALRLVFDDIANVSNLVADINSVSDWNTFFDLPNLGGAFTSVEIDGNDVILKGGSNIKVKPGLLYDIGYQYLVSIDDTGCITSVGGDAFSYCNKLTDVNLPECTIIYGWEDSPYEDYGGFGTCPNLLNINIPKLESIGNWGFGSCISLTTIDFPNLISAGYSCFPSCTSLTTVDLPNLTTAGNRCFYSCHSLTTVNLHNLISVGDECFYDCYNLSVINANNIITAGQYAFYYCTPLTSLSFPNLTNAGYGCFNFCSSLTTINLPNLITLGDYCFSDCTSLTTITLPSCTNLGTTIGYDGVFYDISGNIITVTLPASLMTCNIGNPDGDIQYLQANNTVTIITV